MKKPHIKQASYRRHSILTERRQWICVGAGAIGFGASAVAAYSYWKSAFAHRHGQ